MFLTDVDLSHPLTDHPFWRDVRGVWLPVGNLAHADVFYDLGPRRLNGTAYGDPTWPSNSHGLYVNMKDSCRLFETNHKPPVGDTTILARVNIGVRNLYGNMILSLDEGDASLSRNWQFGVDQSSPYPLKWVVSKDGSSVTKVKGSTGISLSTWCDVGVAFANNDGTTAFYINGEQDATASSDYPIYSTVTTSLRIGRAYYANSTTAGDTDLEGYLAYVFLFDRMLSEDEMSFAYDQSLKNYPELIRTYPTKTYIFVGAYQTLITSNRKSIIRI